jgi:hypothetical protein
MDKDSWSLILEVCAEIKKNNFFLPFHHPDTIVNSCEFWWQVIILFIYLVCDTIGTVATPGLLCQPRVIVKMIVEKQMECRLAGETEVLGENLPQHHFCTSQFHYVSNIPKYAKYRSNIGTHEPFQTRICWHNWILGKENEYKRNENQNSEKECHREVRCTDLQSIKHQYPSTDLKHIVNKYTPNTNSLLSYEIKLKICCIETNCLQIKTLKMSSFFMFQCFSMPFYVTGVLQMISYHRWNDVTATNTFSSRKEHRSFFTYRVFEYSTKTM